MYSGVSDMDDLKVQRLDSEEETRGEAIRKVGRGGSMVAVDVGACG